MWKKTGFIAIIIIILSCSQIYAEGEIESEDMTNQDLLLYDLDDIDLLTATEILPFLLWDRETLDKWLAAGSIIGWTVIVAAIILNPPVGMAAALLAVLGLNISTVFFAFGLGTIFGVW